MIGVVIVTHNNLGFELLKVLEHVMGPQEAMASFSLEAEDDLELKHKELDALIQQVDQGQGVLLLTDMFGGTPSNLAISFLDRHNVEVLAGVNVPMLVKLASVRKEKGLVEAAQAAQTAAKAYINMASSLLAAS